MLKAAVVMRRPWIDARAGGIVAAFLLLPIACGQKAGESSTDASAPAMDAAIEGGPAPGLDGTVDAPSDAPADGPFAPAICASSAFGPGGGVLVHPLGASLVVPAGALAATTSLTLCSQSAPSLAGASPIGPEFQAGPEGQTFFAPVDVVLPFDSTLLPVGAASNGIQVRMAPQGTSSFQAMQSVVDLPNGVVHARTTHFTQFVPGETPSPVVITSPGSTLPSAIAGASYSVPFVASGGVSPYSWTVPSSSALPPGLTLSGSGVLGGAPTVPDNYDFFVQVSDNAGDSVALAVALVVTPSTNPVPTLTQVAPSSVAQGSADTVVVLTGTGFVPLSKAAWDGVAIATTFLGATQLAAEIPAADLATGGSHAITVVNPAPGGGTSGPVTFTATPATLDPVPSLASVAPSQVAVSAVNVQVTLTGASFVTATTAVIGTTPIATTYVSATQLVADLPAAYLSAPSVVAVGAFTPPPGGGYAATPVNVVVGTVNPVATLTAIAPVSVAAGSGAFALTLTGSGFVPGAEAFFGSTALATTYNDATTLQAAVPASLVATAGGAPVLVVNPTPGGGASQAINFSIFPSGDASAGDGGVLSTVSQCTTTYQTYPAGNYAIQWESMIGNLIAVDPSGDLVTNTWATGSIGTPEIYKFDASCNLLWTTDFEILDPAMGETWVAADSTGNVFVVLANTNYVPGTQSEGGPGVGAPLIAKYGLHPEDTQNAQPVWTVQLPGSANGLCGPLAVDAAGGVFVPCYFSTNDVGTLLRYDANGNLTLNASFPGASPGFPQVVVAGSGALYLTNRSGYVAELSPADGSVVWSTTFANALITGMAVDPAGDLLLVGASKSTGGPVDLGSGSYPAGDSFLSKQSGSTGAGIWSKAWSTALESEEPGGYVGVDSAGNVLMAMYPAPPTGQVGNAQELDALLFDPSGNPIANRSFVNYPAGALAIQPSGTIVFTSSGQDGTLQIGTLQGVE